MAFAPELGKHTGADYFLERREPGLINIGGDAQVTIDGVQFAVKAEEALYIGKGARTVTFASVDASRPAKLYFNSTPAHAEYPHRIVTQAEPSPETLGDSETANRRTIYKYIVPTVRPSCQLVMGMTKLEAGSVWNTMPCHTHDRRMEVYFYFNLPPEGLVFHMMGQPQETRTRLVDLVHA